MSIRKGRAPKLFFRSPAKGSPPYQAFLPTVLPPSFRTLLPGRDAPYLKASCTSQSPKYTNLFLFSSGASLSLEARTCLFILFFPGPSCIFSCYPTCGGGLSLMLPAFLVLFWDAIWSVSPPVDAFGPCPDLFPGKHAFSPPATASPPLPC